MDHQQTNSFSMFRSLHENSQSMKALSTFAIIVAFAFSSLAQQTGSFDQTISFPQADYSFTRTLYFHVPSDYDPSSSYPVVVGFRGGPNVDAGQFRDQLTFLSDSIGAIIMCPENEDHFWNNEGQTKLLFNYSLDTLMAQYNVDTNMVYLTGLSYGGRHAVIVSMDTDDGPIPNLRGVIPFATGSDSHLAPDYADIQDFPPACLCIGLADSQTFISVSNTLHNDITANGGTSFLNEIAQVGHTVAFATYPEEMMECINFIEAQHNPSTVESPTSDQIKVFPNPASSVLTIEIPSAIDARSIRLTDSNGRLVLSVPPTSKTIDVNDLANGIYHLLVEADSVIKKQITINR